MKIRMKVNISGTFDGKDWPAIGGTTEVADHVGADMCAAGLAEPVAEIPAQREEKAVEPEPEKRTAPRRRTQKRG